MSDDVAPDSDDEEDGEDDSTGTEAEEIEQGQLDNTNLEDSNLEESALLEASGLADDSEAVEEESGNELEGRVEQRDEKESEEMKRKIARNGGGTEEATQQGGTVEANRPQASALDDHASQWIHTFTKPQALRYVPRLLPSD